MQAAKLSRSATRTSVNKTSANKVQTTQPKAVLRAAASKEQDKDQAQPGLVRAALKSTRVSSPDDPEEKEADNTADKVMRMPANQITEVKQGSSQLYRFLYRAATEDDSTQEKEQAEKQTDGESLQRKTSPQENATAKEKSSDEEEEPVQTKAAPDSSEDSEKEEPEKIAAKAEGRPNMAGNIQAEIRAATSAGRPLPLSVRQFMEPRFNADFSNIRIHTDNQSSRLNRRVSARAFAYRNHLFFGDNQYQPDSDDGKRLIAHELTHTIQQGAATQNNRSQQSGSNQNSAESPSSETSSTGSSAASAPVQSTQEAPSTTEAAASPTTAASPVSTLTAAPAPMSTSGDTANVQRAVKVSHRTGDQVQRLGISDALDYFADRAHHIPGFRMFTILLGINPINMSRVVRSPANILRAIVEFLPGGGLITQALDNHGVFERVGNWISQQLNSLSITGTAIRNAINRFLDSLSWRDIFDLSGVWQRARRIFTEPITRIINFARSLMSGILRFIKEAVLMPLARMAAQTRGWNLLCAVLGRNPITGEAVERNAENLIGGFMRLIGQEEVWQNIQRANAIPRAWAWFQGALAGLMGFVRAIPRLVMNALNALRIAQLVNVLGIFGHIARTFAGFALRFIRWAGRQVMKLLEIIFQVVAPGLMPYLRRVRSAFGRIIRNPVGFIRNLVRAGILGFRQFSRNFLTHLRTALINWLTGTLEGTGVYIPQAFNLRELIKFVLSVLGLTWQNVRRKLVRVIGERPVAAMERGFALVRTLITEGPAALWQQIRQGITNLRQMVIQQIMNFVAVRIVQAAVIRLVSMLNPAGAFVQAILAIYNTIMFFVERLRTIMQVARSVINSIVAIAAGRIRPAAARVERAMVGGLTLVISFLARLLGLGGISRAIQRIINRIRRPIDRALDRAIRWIVRQGRRFLRRLARTGVPRDPRERLRRGLNAAKQVVRRMPRNNLGAAIIRRALAVIKTRYGFRTLEPRIQNNRWWVFGRINPGTGIDSGVEANRDNASEVAAALPDQIDILDSGGTVQIQGYSRSRRAGALPRSIFSGAAITLNQARFTQGGRQQTQSLGSGQRIQYTIAAANGDYAPPARIAGIVDSSNPEEASTYNGHRHAFDRFKRRWWRGVDSGSESVQRLITRGWLMTGNKRGLQAGTRKWTYIHSLFNAAERRAYGSQPKRKQNMLNAFDNHPSQYRVDHFYQQWDTRIGEQTEIHHMLPLDFGGTNSQTFIPLSRDMHTKNGNSVHLAFWNPLKRWLVGLRNQGGSQGGRTGRN
ncbi:DUF4157 domain-containing protein [Corallincola platygyrae]|uniref:DUF4157 domain-containing protein n=1 Tax=Corallincola platygyrae TaxID=1193278 RepID=A0ABW4XML5_9GAMM